jgi:hypothetical protein
MARRAALGDVFEVATPCGLAYVQYINRHPEDGDVVRVIPGVYPERPPDLDALVSGPTRFAVFYPVTVAARRGLAAHLGNFEIPAGDRPLPHTRLAGLGDADRYGWILYDGPRELGRVRSLSPEQASWPEAAVWNHAFLISRIASDWSWPDTALSLPHRQPRPISPCHDIGVPWPQMEDDAEGVRHSLYFAERSAAEAVQSRLTDRKLLADVVRSGDDQSWLLLVTDPTGDHDRLEDDLMSLAREFAGTYDGHEHPVG